MIKEAIQSICWKLGCDLKGDGLHSFPDMSKEDRQIIDVCRPYTMTSVQRLLGLISATRYVARAGIAGDIAECGVWRGGSMMAVALTLMQEQPKQSRRLYLYDTFSGMPAPSRKDSSYNGTTASSQLDNTPKGSGVWCFAGLKEVKTNLMKTCYPADLISYVEGKVEDTIPAMLPSGLAILRLDTDWYDSTKHELVHLYPLLASKGVLIMDDYGHWQGARKAIDEYFLSQNNFVYMHRLDYTGRLVVKQ